MVVLVICAARILTVKVDYVNENVSFVPSDVKVVTGSHGGKTYGQSLLHAHTAIESASFSFGREEVYRYLFKKIAPLR